MKLKNEYRQTVIDTLKCYSLLVAHIDDLVKQLAEVMINDGVVAIDYSGDGIKTNSINKLVENTALKNIEDTILLKEKIENANGKLSRLNAAINTLELLQKEIVIYKYIRGYAWEDIKKETNYSIRMCQRKLNKAVEKIAYIFYGDRAFEYEVVDNFE